MRRIARLTLLLIALYLTFVGGSAYYNLFFSVRVFHHAFITVIGGLWLFNRIQKGSGLPQTPLNLPIFAAVIVWFITSLTGLDPRMSLESTWFLLIHVLFYFAIVDLLQRGRQKQLMEIQFLLGTLIIFITVIELGSWYFGWGIMPGTDVGWVESGMFIPSRIPRVSLAMNISTLLAGYVAPLLTLTITWAMTSSRRDYRRILWILAGSLAIVLFLTYSRGGWLSFAGATGTLILFQLARTQWITRYIPAKVILIVGAIGGTVAAIGIVAILTFPVLRSGDEIRVDMWKAAVNITTESPITGVGVGQFGRAFRDYRTPELARDKLASAHNIVLNTMSETGILGVVVGGWLLILFARTTWKNWQSAEGRWRKQRIEGAIAALVGVTIHSMVDVFTITPNVLIIILLGAYCVIGHKTWQDEVPQGRRLPAIAGLIILVLYGVAFVQFDRAQAVYFTSNQIGEAQVAANFDPHLNLYQLNLADITNTREAYQAAVELEPTWDVGWVNLANFAEADGDYEAALEYLEHGRQINPYHTASLHWARIAEAHDLRPESEIMDYYLSALRNPQNPYLPLSTFWWETELRQDAVRQYLDGKSVEIQYRVLSVHVPEEAAEIVPENPRNAAEWWVVGQYQLTIENNMGAANSAFTEAISLAPDNGDYYVSRARTQSDVELASHDLDFAQLIGTTYEYPNAVRAELTDDADEALSLKLNAIPARGISQEFASVMYGGRPAKYDIVRPMRFPGPGREVLTPWYEVAAVLEAGGDVERAIKAYELILDNAPFEAEAAERLEALRSGG